MKRRNGRAPRILMIFSLCVLLAGGYFGGRAFLPSTMASRMGRLLHHRSDSRWRAISPHNGVADSPSTNASDTFTASASSGTGDMGGGVGGGAGEGVDEGVQTEAQTQVMGTTVAATTTTVTTVAKVVTTATASTTVKQEQSVLGGGKSGDDNTRTCYTNGRSQNAVCVHVPLCMRHTSMVYLAETLRCGAYTNGDRRDVTLSQSSCLELERYVEGAAEMHPIQHKAQEWLKGLDKQGSLLWFEGDSLLLRLPARYTSVPHFASRILMLHHMLQHAHRYGLGEVSNIVIAAHENVAKKIRYTKSWHHGLLSAIVYPNELVYSHSVVEGLLANRRMASNTSNNGIIVFVSDGLWKMAKGKRVPCFRRVALGAAGQQRLLLEGGDYPGTTNEEVLQASGRRYADAETFRHQTFASLGFTQTPKMEKKVVYLHRASTRTLTADGLQKLEGKLRVAVGAHEGFSYRLVDMGGLTFPEQVKSIAGTSIVIGIHGTQMLNTLFLAKGAGIVEMFPFRFHKDLFVNGSGGGLFYASHEVVSGEDFNGLSRFSGNVGECQRLSSECRKWYQSDERAIEFGLLDAAAVAHLVERAIQHVKQFL